MGTIITRRFDATVLVAALMIIAAAIANAGERTLYAVDSNHIAIKGYDPVAYFTDRKAVKGETRFAYVYDDAKWQFANAAHREMFVADPDHYMPQYGGFCAFGTAQGYKVDGDPNIWKIVDNKLYLNLAKKVGARWREDIPGNIKIADEKWQVLKDKAPGDLQ